MAHHHQAFSGFSQRQRIIKFVAFGILATGLLCIALMMKPFNAFAEYQGKISFAEPPAAGKHEGGFYGIQLKGDPRLPLPEDAYDKDWLKEIRVTVYNLKNLTTFDKKQVLNYKQVFSTLGYNPAEPDHSTVEVREYVTADNQPQPGDHLVAHISIDQWDGMNQDFYTDVATVEGATHPSQSFNVIHTFVAEDGSSLPHEVTDLLPSQQSNKPNGTEVTPTNPTKTSVTSHGTTWVFKGWDRQNATIQGSDVTFIGTWAQQNALGRLQIKVLDANDPDLKLQGAGFKLTLDEEGNSLATSADGSITLNDLISNKQGECGVGGTPLHTIDLKAQTYWLHQIKTAPDHKSMSPNPRQITVTAGSGFKTEIIENAEGSDPQPIPFEVMDDPYAPDIPHIYVKLLDENVHPINGLSVTVIRPDGSSEKLYDAKVNDKHILVLKPKDFAAQGKDQPELGHYTLKLTQPDFQPTDIPINFAERTTTPLVGKAGADHIYKEDGSIEITTDKQAKLWVTFMDNPRSEENLVEIAPNDIDEYPAGTYTVYFEKYRERITTSTVMKVVAQAPHKAKSDIVIVSIKDARSGHIHARLVDDKGAALSGGKFTITTSSDTSQPAQALDGTLLTDLIADSSGHLLCGNKPLGEYELKIQGYFIKQLEAPQGYLKDNGVKEVWLTHQNTEKNTVFTNKKLAPTGKDASVTATLSIGEKSSSHETSLVLSARDVAQPVTLTVHSKLSNLIEGESYTVTASLIEKSEQPSLRSVSQPNTPSESVHINGTSDAQDLLMSLTNLKLDPTKEYIVAIRAVSEHPVVDADSDGVNEIHEVTSTTSDRRARSITFAEEPHPVPNPDPDPTPIPVPDPDPSPTPDPAPRPTPDPTPEPAPTPTPDPKPQPDFQPKPEHQPDLHPILNIIPRPTLKLASTIISSSTDQDEDTSRSAATLKSQHKRPENTQTVLPKTGDSSSLLDCFGLCVVGSLGLIATSRYLKLDQR